MAWHFDVSILSMVWHFDRHHNLRLDTPRPWRLTTALACHSQQDTWPAPNTPAAARTYQLVYIRAALHKWGQSGHPPATCGLGCCQGGSALTCPESGPGGPAVLHLSGLQRGRGGGGSSTAMLGVGCMAWEALDCIQFLRQGRRPWAWHVWAGCAATGRHGSHPAASFSNHWQGVVCALFGMALPCRAGGPSFWGRHR